MSSLTVSRLAKRAFTLLEVMVTLLILTGMLAMVGQSLVSGARTTEVVNLKSDAVRQANTVVQKLGLELRYVAYEAGVLRFTGPVAIGDTQVYTYRLASGLSQTAGASFTQLCDRRLVWDQVTGSLTLTSYNADDATVPSTTQVLVTAGIPKTYKDSTLGDREGFIIQPNGSSSLQLSLNIQLSTTDDAQHLEWVSKQTAIFLRQSKVTDLSATTATGVPVISGPSSMTGTVGTPLSFGIDATGGVAKYGAQNLPTGLSCNTTTGVISGTPGLAGSYTVMMSAANEYGQDDMACSLVIFPPVGTGSPPVVTGETVAGTARSPFAYQVQATNMATKFNPIGYDATTTLPAGLSLNTSTGLLSGTPTVSGNFTVGISAANADGMDTGTFSIVIAAAPSSPPVIPSLTTISATVGVPVSFQIPATNMSAIFGPQGYSLSGLPAELSLDPVTGVVSGTPITPLTYSLYATAKNADGSGTGYIKLVVAINPGSPTVSSASVTATWGVPFQYVISATYMTPPDKPVGYKASGLPAGLSIDTKTGAISGIPTVSGGTWQVIISAKNELGEGFNTLTLTIPARVPNPPVVSVGSGACALNALYSYQIVATNTGSLYAPISYEADGLPFGLMCDTSGKISGAPSAIGIFTVTLTVGNSDGKGTAIFTLSVSDPDAPVVTGGSISGAQGSPLTAQITASNVKNNDKLSYSADSLPPGLSLDGSTGVLSGTPTTDGTWTATITVINTSRGNAEGVNTITFTIANPQAPVLNPQAQTIIVGVPTSFQIIATLMDAVYGPKSYEAVGLPPGLTINAGTGVISGTTSLANTYSVTIKATNDGGTGSAILTLTVQEPSTVISISASPVALPANKKINGSKFVITPPAGYTVATADITATAANISSFAYTKSVAGGIWTVSLTGTAAAASTPARTVTVNVTAKKSGFPNITATKTMTF